MTYTDSKLVLGFFCLLLTAGCGTVPSVKYQVSGANNKDAGYEFVVPRTSLKVTIVPEVTPAAGKPPTSFKISLTPVPMSTNVDGSTLKRFRVIADNSSFKLVSTNITSATYISDLIINSFGTKVIDNRKNAIDAAFSVLSLAGVVVGKGECNDDALKQTSFDAFVIQNPGNVGNPVKINDCWQYQITKVAPIDASIATGIDKLGADSWVSWFPFPACQTASIVISSLKKDSRIKFESDISVSSGQYFRTIPLSLNGKVEMHTDFCVADASSGDSSLTSNWDLLNAAIKDLSSLKKSD
jgi:hypothetical protein